MKIIFLLIAEIKNKINAKVNNNKEIELIISNNLRIFKFLTSL